MPNDFLPFVVTRAAAPADLQDQKTNPVKLIVNIELLNSIGLIDENKEKVYKKAVLLQASNQALFDLDNLPLPLAHFISWYDTQTQPIKDEIFSQTVVKILKKDISDLVVSNEFKTAKENVTKGLLISYITEKNTQIVRPLFLRAFKFIAAFETLVSLQPTNVAKTFKILLQRIILFPKEIFPVNFESEESINRKKELQDKRDQFISEQQKKIVEKTVQLEKYQNVTRELLNKFDAQVNRPAGNIGIVTGANTALESNINVSAVSRLSYSNLNKETIDTLSHDTKDILQKEAFSLDSINVPMVLKKLDETIKDVSIQLKDLKGGAIPTGGYVFGGQLVLPTPGQCTPVAVLPTVDTETDIAPRKGNGYVQRMYIGELQKVRQTLKCYELGEIAYIENVMLGERKIAKYRQLQKTEESTLVETETVQDTERETLTNNQFDLQTETAQTISSDKSKEAGITVTGSYGPVTATATGNIAVRNSTETSSNTSTNYSRDVINRSLQKIKERILKQTLKKTTQEIERNQEHSFDNTRDGGNHINGIYQWVNKIYEVQVINYGLRQFLEFIIPDPAAFYRYALQNKPVEGLSVEKPERPGYCVGGVFKPLEPKDLTEYNYLDWVRRFNIPDIKLPPVMFRSIFFNKLFTIDQTDGKQPKLFSTTETPSITIPKGYFAKSGEYSFTWARSALASTTPNDQIYFDIFLGDFKIIERYFSEFAEGGANRVPHFHWPPTNIPVEYLQNLVSDDAHELSLGVSVAGFSTLAFTINLGINILCERSKESFEQWQIATFNQIMTVYHELDLQYQNELSNKQATVFTSIQGRNPFINREIEKTELKKLSLAQFTGQSYESFHAMMETDPVTNYPQQNVKNSKKAGQYIQFFENAFEWQNMTYIFYDYFWSNKGEWPGILSIRDIDPLFEKFLHSGAARVQVPVRFGFEELVLSFNELQPGTPWVDGSAPLIDGHENTIPYISMLEEIKAQMNVDFNLAEGTITVTEGSSIVKGVGTFFTNKDRDREIIINTQSYRIALVDEATQQITLRKPYKKMSDESMDNIQYYLGIKFIGEPWDIVVPTELIYLNNADPVKIPDE